MDAGLWGPSPTLELTVRLLFVTKCHKDKQRGHSDVFDFHRIFLQVQNDGGYNLVVPYWKNSETYLLVKTI